MAPLVMNTICRYTIEGLYTGNAYANILDMHIDTTGTTQSREDAIEQVAEDIWNNWCDHILNLQDGNTSVTSVSWVDLDTDEGTTGSISGTTANPLPQNGAVTGQGAPGNVSGLVTKTAPGGGRKTRNGRWYIVGIPEATTDDANANSLTNAAVTAWNSALDSFRTGVEDPGSATEASRFPVVLHTENTGTVEDPNIIATGYNEITDFAMNALLATQRRRLRR